MALVSVLKRKSWNDLVQSEGLFIVIMKQFGICAKAACKADQSITQSPGRIQQMEPPNLDSNIPMV